MRKQPELELQLTNSDLLRSGLLQRRHTGTGQSSSSRTVSYRLNQATGGILTTSVSNQETGQRGVTGTHSATNLNRLMHSMPDTLLSDQHGTAATEGGKHVLDAVAEQLLGGAGGQLGAGLQLLPVVATGQLSQLLRVGLNQGGLVLTGDGRNQRRLRGINSNLALVAGGAQCRHQLGVVGRLQTRRQRTTQSAPLERSTTSSSSF